MLALYAKGENFVVILLLLRIIKDSLKIEALTVMQAKKCATKMGYHRRSTNNIHRYTINAMSVI